MVLNAGCTLESSRSLLTLTIRSVALRPALLASRSTESQADPDPLNWNLHFRKLPRQSTYMLKFAMCYAIAHQRPGAAPGHADVLGLRRSLDIVFWKSPVPRGSE